MIKFQPLSRKPMLKATRKAQILSLAFLIHTIGAGGTSGTNKLRKELTPLREPSASHSRSIKVTSFIVWEQERQAQYVFISILILCFMPYLSFSFHGAKCTVIYALFSASHSSTFSLTAATNALALG